MIGAVTKGRPLRTRPSKTGAQLLQDADETLPQPRREQMLPSTLTASIEGNYVDPGRDEGHSMRSDALGKRTS